MHFLYLVFSFHLQVPFGAAGLEAASARKI
jgi:hypothetical protein